MRRKDREISNPEKIRTILENCKVCRIGLQDEDGIYIVPMNFGYTLADEHLTLYFHCAGEGRKMEILKKNPRVGFEMDCGHELVSADKACLHSFHYASVIGNGCAQFLHEPKDKKQALTLLMKHQTGKDFEFTDSMAKAVMVFRIRTDRYTCKSHE